MYMHQKVTMPRLHGDGPKNFASAVRLPSGPRNTPKAPVKFKSFKEAMQYLKEEKEKEDEDKE